MSRRIRKDDITDYLLEYIDNRDIIFEKQDEYDLPEEKLVYTFKLNDQYRNIKTDLAFNNYIQFISSLKLTLKRWNLTYNFSSSHLQISVPTTDEIKNITFNGDKITTNSYLHKLSIDDNGYTFKFNYRRYYGTVSNLVHISFYLDNVIDNSGKTIHINNYPSIMDNWDFTNILSILENGLSENKLPFKSLIINRPSGRENVYRVILDFKFDL